MRVANVAKTFIALGMLSLAAGLSGCSRGISGSTDHITSNTPPTNCGVVNPGVAYLFFSTSDATCPGKPLAVDAGADVLSNIFYPATVFVAGTYDPPTRTVNDIHNHALVYAKTSGNFYKVSALKSSGTPTPTQLSSENSAGKICPAFAPTDAPTEAVDFANPDHSQFVYHTPGKNESCNDADDIYKMIRLDMGPADAPVTAKQPIGTALHDWTTGAISGWLVNDAGALKKCDANFANCQASSVASSLEIKNYKSQVSIAGSNRWLVDLDHVLYVYDGDTNTLSAEIHTMVKEISPLVTAVINDSNKFYFSTGKAPKKIYSAPIDGSASATLLVTAAASINGLALSSSNTLLYWTNTEINAVSKTTPLVTGSSTITMAAVNANHVYYTVGIGEAHPAAGMVNDDGNLKSETPDASWQGFSLVTSWNLTDGFATTSQTQTIIRAEGYNALGNGRGFAGAKLRSFDAATTNPAAEVGTVPTDIGSIYCSSSGANVLCNGSNASLQNDIFLLNAVTPNSLVRVTDTPTKGEFPIN